MLSRVLFVSPHQHDADSLRLMLGRISIRCDHAANLAEARERLHDGHYGVVLTESVLPDGVWLDVLECVQGPGRDKQVIVTSPVVDERFWAEVLNLGGYDMLAQPFSETEVQRVLFNACARAAA